MTRIALSFYICCLLLASILYLIPVDIKIYNSGKAPMFFYIGSGLLLCVSAIDIYLKRNMLFEKIDFFKGFISVFLAVIVVVYFYSHKTVLGLSIALASLCLLYGIYKRQFYKPHPIMIAIFIFSMIKLASVLWADNINEAFNHIDYYCFFIFLPILSCFYKVEVKEIKLFIYVMFSIFTAILTLETIAYILLMKELDLPLFAFLSFNKAYIGGMESLGLSNYYHLILWTKTNHPSKMAWICMTVGATGYWLWQEEKGKIISTYELLLYFILVTIFAFAVQARVVILGIFILLGLFVWIALMKRVKTPKLIAFFTLFALTIGIITTNIIVSKVSFFNDEFRVKMNEATLAHFKEHPFLGGGAGYETQMIQLLNFDLNKLHNEFLTALSDQGLLGLGLFLLCHVLVVYYGIKHKYFLGIYVLVAFVIFNSTEGVMGLPICIPFFLYCLLPFDDYRIVSTVSSSKSITNTSSSSLS